MGRYGGWIICLFRFWFTAELSFPNNYLLALYHSQQIRGDAVYQIYPTKDVEASEAYPDVKYTTVDEYLNQFLWFLKFEEHMRSIMLCKMPNKTTDIVFLFVFFYSRKIPSFVCLILQKPFILIYLLLTQKNSNTVICSQKYCFQMFTSFLDEYVSLLIFCLIWWVATERISSTLVQKTYATLH